ncbi:T9SS type A sorting domain-containing protein [Hymenobacter tibetensis]|uniref:T9SS type A sorting domain-containing protein n=1 Tax=Hymenobacter tibetensis TaxID=497967 RepID=A0ABY4D3W1_9BACT|nr:T9SS type A sorting domain-containing protein [Hymenobacter tibetensis]UOG74618.1 T9SS type A sorting domain-containing protein [Hymenobacter tibetensis]
MSYRFTLPFRRPLRASRWALLGVLAGVGSTLSAQAQVPSFPGAEGAGKFTSGGRGTVAEATTVFEVTNLTDDGLPGSLRYAVTQAATHRTVVFRVSGTIHLLSDLRLSRANTTIAGQTAPGDGICVADFPVSLNADNIIVRFVRFRLGDKNQNQGMVNGSGDDDAFGGIGRRKIMIDHCTMSWSADEACTVYRGDSTTLQWNIISEPLDYSYHFETGDTDFERHGYGGIWGGRNASMHHNLLAHMRGRMPRFDGSRTLTPVAVGQENVDFRNNVLYNWASYNVNGGEGGNYNVVNNYYKYGPSTATGSSGGVPIRSEVLNPYKQNSAPVLPYGKYYLTGNYVEGYPAVTARNWLGAVMNGGTRADTAAAKVTTPFTILPPPPQSALDAYMAVLQQAGCVLPVRDALDQRIVNDVINRTGALIDVQGGFPHGTPYSTSQVAWPVLNSLPAPPDTDHDGMPDAWETSMGLNPNNATDRNVRGATGYTMLENYLNGLTATVLALPAASDASTEVLQAYPNPSQNQLTLAHPAAHRGAHLAVYSFDGRQVLHLPVSAGTRKTYMQTAALVRGNYLVLYTDGQQRLLVKFSKE